MKARFEGRVAIVTGGGGGLGRAAASAFAREGAAVAVVDIDQVAADETAAIIDAEGGRALSLAIDVAESAQVERMVAVTVKAFGRLDAAFNNAGVSEGYGADDEWNEAILDRALAINVRGVYLGMKYQVPEMQRGGGGAIVNTASIAGLVGTGTYHYVASKHAVVGLTRAVAMKYASFGIRINAVCPGAVRTAMVERSIAAGFGPVLDALHPIGRIGEATEIADAVLWLCSDQASFVTGHPLAVDGGATAR
ncbi:glucose 1-dehydrogenase [Sphingosinicella terrae]|uniref:glucose 1-dehydrogenase n=1 Tax=Sphingosinicella terrae TaxID=2172047 RepID=UPI000E0D6231|nr:glucose 1-dehydrogenase [Sphingosinicella terrae]